MSWLFIQSFLSKKTSKLRDTGLCKGNSPVTGGFPSQKASNAKNVSIWWRHHVSVALWRHVALSALVIIDSVMAGYPFSDAKPLPEPMITCCQVDPQKQTSVKSESKHKDPRKVIWKRLSAKCPGLNTLRTRQNGRHFADDIFKCIFLNENVWIPIKISLKFVPKGPINNIPVLVRIMAWRRPGAKPLSETMMVRLPTHICVIRPQWVYDLTVGF